MSNIAALQNVPDVSFIENMSLRETLEQTRELYIKNYRDITGEEPSMNPADPVTLVLQTMALMAYQNMQYIDAMGRAEMLKTATGDNLDALAAMLGVTRKPAGKATVTMRFTLATERPGATAIPAGVRVRTEGGLYFNTLDYAEIPAGELTVDVQAQAEEAGTDSNGIAEGMITTLVDPIPYVESVTNTDQSSGGTDTESDDELTERIFLAPSTYSCAGPKDAYEYYAKAWRSDVADVQVTSPSPCDVVIYFMLDGGKAPNEAEMRAMQEYISGDTMRPMCDRVTCRAPDEIEYSIDVTYYIADSDAKSAASIQAAATAAVEEYQMWQRKLGRDINPTELIARLRAAGVKRVRLTAPEDVTVPPTSIAKVTDVKVTYGGLEDD